MKIIKKILLVLVVLIASALVVALFVEKKYQIEREIVINKPTNEVFDYIKYLKNQNYYSKWSQMDPKMKKKYTGTDGTVGFISSWSSDADKVGVGEQEILKITEGKRLDTKLRFKVPFEAEDDAYMITEEAGANSTKVTWGFKGEFPYPMNLMGAFMDMDKQVGGDLEIGLKNLKKVLEKE